jgi:2-polyprenyl-3-methyl-5-hydroxy-6-metoxy-1,4-benzoquinol methylase
MAARGELLLMRLRLPLSVRRSEPEWMDDPGLDARLHREALIGLEHINVASLSVSAVWRPLVAALRRRSIDTFSMLDVACGAGDLAIGLAQLARREGFRATVHGCDISPTAVGHARARAVERRAEVTFFQHDVLRGDLPRSYDVVVNSLFVHHLDDATVTQLLRRLAAHARSLAIVTDLDRSHLGFAVAWMGTRLLTRSPVVHLDSLRSVRAAFTRAEAEDLTRRAGLWRSHVTSIWPFRWRLVVECGP